MFIHLGGEKIIRSSELIAIFDLSMGKSSKISKQYIAEAMKNKQIEIIGEEENKSLVLTQSKVYYSPISSMTLKNGLINF
ncbi:extracellular matrix regulator RemB [Paenibacillus larvae]|uniref:extracellular matrix regulator RemB n=1 Tax=Paenibacillus larvae TaxID=1464 RepID=UPI002891CBDE|nr:extracellular matrix/biofilm biosynthesis regulator RemA family protein [Paenibacillus larvae]MDT2192476.1 DUF370 domain-containing protein [Paenibacillus larvae]MDT2239769.1 DUF370 domain-containing protein [Paenibacillus larvae]MDT2303780.1 DUF370 domain-containing protein [Paenibacillus larvae]